MFAQFMSGYVMLGHISSC